MLDKVIQSSVSNCCLDTNFDDFQEVVFYLEYNIFGVFLLHYTVLICHSVTISSCPTWCVTKAVGYHGQFHRFIHLHKWGQQDSACEVCVYNVACGLNFCENVFLRIEIRTRKKDFLPHGMAFKQLKLLPRNLILMYVVCSVLFLQKLECGRGKM